jgi:uncharacterized protein YjiK
MTLFSQSRFPLIGLLLLVYAVTLQTSCAQKGPGSPEGYDLRTPQKRQLSKVLNEISGLSFNPDSNSLFAISDSKRKVFSINLKTEKLRDYAEKFWEQSDFEDVVNFGDTTYVLISDGTILCVPGGVKDTSSTIVYPFWSEEENDFETMYYDSAVNGLVILCKTCGHEKGQGTRTAYRFNLSTKDFDTSAFYSISTEDVRASIKKSDVTFKPSAAAIHPIDKRLYILSSAGQLLVITDTRGKVLEVYNLNPDRNPQAEGISFAPNGTMYISNEGKYGKATLHIYHYSNQNTQKSN